MFYIAYNACEPLAEHVLAGTSYMRDCDGLISSTLKAIHHAPTGWAGTETLSAAVMVCRSAWLLHNTKDFVVAAMVTRGANYFALSSKHRFFVFWRLFRMSFSNIESHISCNVPFPQTNISNTARG